MSFIELRPDLQKWDVDRIIKDLEHLIESNGFNWTLWAQKGMVNCEWGDTLWTDMNLTSNPNLCPTFYDRMWRYSGRRFSESIEIDDNDLYILQPELEGTYTGGLIKFLQVVFGPIRVRLHNRVNKEGLYWHKDAHAPIRYHMALWTNPGSFLVWTDKELKWHPTFDPEQAKEPFKINAQFIPLDGQVYALETGNVIHGVANIGVGWAQNSAEQSRCHLTFWPVNPK